MSKTNVFDQLFFSDSIDKTLYNNFDNFLIKSVPRKEIKDFVERNHYSHNINGLKISTCTGLYIQNQLVGACVFGRLSTTAWKKFSDSENKVMELRRVVLIDELPKNSESYFIRRSIKIMRKENPEVEILVSYADPEYGHNGIIYQALNFLYIGDTPQDKILITPEGKRYHSRAMRTTYKGKLKPFAIKLRQLYKDGKLSEKIISGKRCYILPLTKKERKKWINKRKSYPKEK